MRAASRGGRARSTTRAVASRWGPSRRVHSASYNVRPVPGAPTPPHPPGPGCGARRPPTRPGPGFAYGCGRATMAATRSPGRTPALMPKPAGPRRGPRRRSGSGPLHGRRRIGGGPGPHRSTLNGRRAAPPVPRPAWRTATSNRSHVSPRRDVGTTSGMT